MLPRSVASCLTTFSSHMSMTGTAFARSRPRAPQGSTSAWRGIPQATRVPGPAQLPRLGVVGYHKVACPVRVLAGAPSRHRGGP
jgi:hypothetical protein